MKAHSRLQPTDATPEREPPLEEFVARPLTVTEDEYEDMARRGAFDRIGKTELRRGVIVSKMNAVHLPHAKVHGRLLVAISRAIEAAGLSLEALPDASVRFGAGFYPIGDIVVYDTDAVLDQDGAVPGAAVRLVIEVAHSSRNDDLGPKRQEYAEAGLAEYWVADVKHRTIQRCAAPVEGRYTREEPTPFGDPAPSLTLPLTVETGGLTR